MALNKVLLIGNVGKDPDVRHLEGGASVASFTLATTERYRERGSGETKELTEWHNIVAWRQLADLAENFIRKGSQIFVEGRIRSRSWDDQNGQKRYITEILADSIQLLGRKGDSPIPSGGAYVDPGAPAPAPAPRPAAAAPAPAPAYPKPQPQQQPISLDSLDSDDSDDLPF
ncbi:MAG: single-stranded DNA-binding protein [Bacteroidales bacterium]|jgi:single-strand DNA-binding protein|nr:single-stranded DNA-binding protein [Bacteroidales bacterium]MBR5670876.1 single-stranded DNA-binding protein [Bacteroidales bacterium]